MKSACGACRDTAAHRMEGSIDPATPRRTRTGPAQSRNAGGGSTRGRRFAVKFAMTSRGHQPPCRYGFRHYAEYASPPTFPGLRLRIPFPVLGFRFGKIYTLRELLGLRLRTHSRFSVFGFGFPIMFVFAVKFVIVNLSNRIRSPTCPIMLGPI